MAETVTKTLYKGDVTIDFYPNSHRYKIKGEKTYLISVTSATGIIDKSRVLINWALGLTGTYLRQYIETAGGSFTSSELIPVIEEALNQHAVKKEEAGSIGSIVHDWAESFALAKGTDSPLPKLPENVDDKVLRGIEAFLGWYTGHSIQFKSTEQMVYSKKYNYVGKFDCVANIDGKNTLIDFKTSKAVYSEQKYQVSGYWGAYEEEYGQTLDQAVILHFNKETGEVTEHHITREDHNKFYPVFLACLTIKQAEKENA